MSKTKEVLDVSMQTRVDMRQLAGIARFYNVKSESPPRSKSELVRSAVKDLHSILERNGLLVPVLTHKDAAEILRKLGINRIEQDNKAAYLDRVKIEGTFAREAERAAQGTDISDAATQALQLLDAGGS